MKTRDLLRHLLNLSACMFLTVSIANANDLTLIGDISSDEDEKFGCTSTQICCQFNVVPGKTDNVCRAKCESGETVVHRENCNNLPRGIFTDDLIDIMLELDASLRQFSLDSFQPLPSLPVR